MKDFEWQDPKNLGYPINTFEEQVSLFVTPDGKKGYYSNENYSSKVDKISMIYEFDIPDEIQPTNKSNYVKGRVIDSETNQYLSAEVDLIKLDTKELLSSVQSDKNSGEYLMVITEGDEYGLYVDKPGYVFRSLSFDFILEKQTEPMIIDILLDPIKPGSSTVLSNIFFEFDKYDLMDKSYAELEQVMQFLNDNPTVKIGIGGHTDDKGTADYNKTLSLNRAKSVYNYLVEQGIEADRLKYKGYGSEKPIVPNDSEENRRKNRRIDFVII
jgi:outer membrane protein OmpA-like peptidoglycan-associated protein